MIESKKVSKMMPILININLACGKCHDIRLLKSQFPEPGDYIRALAFHFRKESQERVNENITQDHQIPKESMEEKVALKKGGDSMSWHLISRHLL